jgi:hypothetical protein
MQHYTEKKQLNCKRDWMMNTDERGKEERRKTEKEARKQNKNKIK